MRLDRLATRWTEGEVGGSAEELYSISGPDRPGRIRSGGLGQCRQHPPRAASRGISPLCGRPSPTRSLSAPALTHGGRTIAWGEFEQRAARLAGALRAYGLGPGSVVACYLYNCPEYFETFLAALKIRAVPANVNYRYGGAELRALLENCEAKALFFDSALRKRVASVRHEVPGVRLLVEVGEDGGAVRWPGACGYQELMASSEPALADEARASRMSSCRIRAGPPACPRVSGTRSAAA